MTTPVRIHRDDPAYLIISRSDFVYPNATEGSAGLREETRVKILEGRTGDIVAHLGNGHLDQRDAAVILEHVYPKSAWFNFLKARTRLLHELQAQGKSLAEMVDQCNLQGSPHVHRILIATGAIK